jgi:hypothetical protein
MFIINMLRRHERVESGHVLSLQLNMRGRVKSDFHSNFHNGSLWEIAAVPAEPRIRLGLFDRFVDDVRTYVNSNVVARSLRGADAGSGLGQRGLGADP